MELVLNNIIFSNQNKRITFDYSYSNGLSKFFKKELFFVEYEEDVSAVPYEVLIIPFLANVMPVAWFASFKVKVSRIDSDFLKALHELKKEFSKYYSIGDSDDIQVIYDEIVSLNKPESNKRGMLFSGGVDAYTTYLRHFDSSLHLFTIQGADIKLDDIKQWNDLTSYIKDTNVLATNPKHNIVSNIRDFISFEVDRLLPDLGWWGKIQHGLALTCLTAPVAYLNKVSVLYIASTRSIKMAFSPWGSMPETDNLIKWSGSRVIHDGYELSRFDKVSVILDKSEELKIYPPLRVCYNEFKTGLNCNVCEKCLRTIFSIIISNRDPRKYGFEIDYSSIYDKILKVLSSGFSTHGTKMYWVEMIDAYTEEGQFIFKVKAEELLKMKAVIDFVESKRDQPIRVVSNSFKLKMIVVNSFPNLFKLYLKIRRKFI